MAQRKPAPREEPPDPVQGAVDAYNVLEFVHAPTATALLLGGGAGVYLAWRLFRPHGLAALMIGIVFGAFLGAVTGVCLYWLFRFFRAMG